MPAKYFNPFVQNICENVNKAFNYKAGIDNPPIYNFNATYTHGPKKAIKLDKVELARMGRASTLEKHSNSLIERSGSPEEHNKTRDTDGRRNSMIVGSFVDDSPNPFSLNSTQLGIMRKEWLEPPRPVEDPNANKVWVSKRKRGFV